MRGLIPPIHAVDIYACRGGLEIQAYFGLRHDLTDVARLPHGGDRLVWPFSVFLRGPISDRICAIRYSDRFNWGRIVETATGVERRNRQTLHGGHLRCTRLYNRVLLGAIPLLRLIRHVRIGLIKLFGL